MDAQCVSPRVRLGGRGEGGEGGGEERAYFVVFVLEFCLCGF